MSGGFHQRRRGYSRCLTRALAGLLLVSVANAIVMVAWIWFWLG